MRLHELPERQVEQEGSRLLATFAAGAVSPCLEERDRVLLSWNAWPRKPCGRGVKVGESGLARDLSAPIRALPPPWRG